MALSPNPRLGPYEILPSIGGRWDGRGLPLGCWLDGGPPIQTVYGDGLGRVDGGKE